MKSFLLGAATAALLLGTPASGATLITLDGGALGAISKGNDLLKPLGFGTSLEGYFGATVSGSASAYRYEFLGFEAGARNRFMSKRSAVSFSTEDFSSNLEFNDPLETSTANTLDFSFLTSLSAASVGGAANSMSSGTPNFFASFGDGSRNGNVLHLFFDDSGAGSDGDHDDLAVRITALATIPVPAPIGLLFGALAGLALLSRRRTELNL